MTRRPIILDDGVERATRIKRYNKRLRNIMALLTAIGLAVTSFYFMTIWNKENRAIETRLQTFTELRKSTLSRFLNSLAKETALWAGHESVTQEAQGYIKIWDKMNWPSRTLLRERYHLELDKNKRQADIAEYMALHEKYHTEREKFLQHHGYYDVFYFNLDGDLVYSVTKEADYALNYESGGGKYADTGLGEAFRAARGLGKGQVVFMDYKHYAPSNNDPAAFLASAMYDKTGRKFGVYAIQVPVNKFDEVMQYSSGLGETGESYAVGEDFLMRNNSRLSEENTLLEKKIETIPIKTALKGKSYLGKSKRAGKTTLVAADSLEFLGNKMAIATEMELSELRQPLKPYIWFYLIAIIMVLLFGIVQYYLLRQKTDD